MEVPALAGIAAASLKPKPRHERESRCVPSP
jgi:hypothetical protein